MKRILLAVLIACGVVLVGGIIDTSNIFGLDAKMPIMLVSTLLAGMVLGIATVYEFQDAKKRKQELLR